MMKRKTRRKPVIKPVHDRCPFCKAKTQPSYQRSEELKSYISDRARIIGASRSGVCSKHQRRLSQEVKRARFLGLISVSSS